MLCLILSFLIQFWTVFVLFQFFCFEELVVECVEEKWLCESVWFWKITYLDMDIAFRLPQSNVVLDGLDSCIVFGGRGFSCAFLGNSRTIPKARFSGVNKIGSRSSSRVECLGDLKVSIGKRGLSWKNNRPFRKNREIWSKCQGNDSLSYVNGNGRNVGRVERR